VPWCGAEVSVAGTLSSRIATPPDRGCPACEGSVAVRDLDVLARARTRPPGRETVAARVVRHDAITERDMAQADVLRLGADRQSRSVGEAALF
jgi:hypothetical protein